MKELLAAIALVLALSASGETVYRSGEAAPPYPSTTIAVPAGQNIDPTANVQKLVEAAIKRLDDLRIAESRRLEDLQTANDRRIAENAAIRAEFAEKLSNAEAKRIDAIRAVDVNAVSIASAESRAQAQVLASQVTQSADNLRNLVTQSAQSLATQQTQASKLIEDRLALLEKSQYTNQGQNQPGMTAQMEARLALLEKSQNEIAGRGIGSASVWGYVVAIFGVLFGAVGLVVGIVRSKKTL